MIDWNPLSNNSKSKYKILYKINQILKYTIEFMLCYYWDYATIKKLWCAIFKFSTVWVFTSEYGVYRRKSLKHNLFFQLLLISMSYTDIPISFTLFEDSDPLACALCKFMLTHAQDSYLLSIWRLLLTLLIYVTLLN